MLPAKAIVLSDTYVREAMNPVSKIALAIVGIDLSVTDKVTAARHSSEGNYQEAAEQV